MNKTNMCSSAQEHISILVGWEWSSGAPGGEGASGVWGPLLEAFFGSFLCGDKKERSRENPSRKREGRRWHMLQYMPYYILPFPSIQSTPPHIVQVKCSSYHRVHFPSPSMVRRFSFGLSAVLLSQALSLSVQAATFVDVSSDSLYRGQIERLADLQIVRGNPDGTFSPLRTVNRAEMLTLLYRAKGITPAVPLKQCFTDVVSGSWYEAVICDAASHGYVGGYPDKKFRPEQEVNRVEAIKMIFTVMGIGLTASTSTEVALYTDLVPTAWYMQYLAPAFERKILPIAGQTGSLFNPNAPLLRGEAAAYIFNALGLTLSASSLSSSVSSAPASSAAASSVVTRASSVQTSSAQSSAPGVVTKDVDFPFSDDGFLAGKGGVVYRLSLPKPVLGFFTVSITGAKKDGVTCRLFKLEKETSLALEYYLGHVEDNTCTLRTALAAGSYQLEIRPESPDVFFTLTSKSVSGDGNDGFSEAKLLLKNIPKTSWLETDDFADWYTFTLSKQTTMSVTVSNSNNLRCLIYPMGDVDIYGFTGPECNETYDFPAGTYVVGIQHRDEHTTKETYTVQYK